MKSNPFYVQYMTKQINNSDLQFSWFVQINSCNIHDRLFYIIKGRWDSAQNSGVFESIIIIQMSEVIFSVLKYSFLAVSSLSCILTIGLILSNRMWNKMYPLLLLLISLDYVGMCFADLMPLDGGCKLAGALFNFFWVNSNLLTAQIVIGIYLKLKGKKALVKNFLVWGITIATFCSVILVTAPLDHYRSCPPKSDQPLYCGNCPNGSELFESLLWLIYLFPLVLAVGCLVLLKRAQKRIEEKLSDDSIFKALWIPYFWFGLLILNACTLLLLDHQQGSWQFYVSGVLSWLMFLNPPINLLFFVTMMRNMNDILGVKVVRCRKLLTGRDESQETLYSLFQ